MTTDIFAVLARHALGAGGDIAAIPNAEELHGQTPKRGLDWRDDATWRGRERAAPQAPSPGAVMAVGGAEGPPPAPRMTLAETKDQTRRPG